MDRDRLRRKLRELLGLPSTWAELAPEFRGRFERDGVVLEKLYGTPLHNRGAVLADAGLRIISREELACLRPDEIGAPQYTLEGWLERIAKDRPPRGPTAAGGPTRLESAPAVAHDEAFNLRRAKR